MPTPINYNAIKQSDTPRTPSVITSKAAQKDLLNIQSIHSDLVRGLANQKVRVDAFNQNKAAELVAQNSMKMEMEKEKMVSDTTAQKNAMDFAQKQAELDIKRSVLSMK